MLTGIHFLLTYRCNFECDHCFLYCGPRSRGTFTIGQVTNVLDEASAMGTIDWIFFEGGEPFLYFPLLVESVRQAIERGFQAGIVTNAYGALSPADAELWLKPLKDAGVSCLSISNDTFHYGEEAETPAATAYKTAVKLGMETAPICIEPPRTTVEPAGKDGKGEPVVGGGAMFRGRAVEKLVEGLPTRPWEEMVTCPHEKLASPSRLHIDSFGNVHICQGISMGNMWETPLSRLVRNYRPEEHPICGPLIQGGPAQLAEELGMEPASAYVDECHLCYLTRRAALEKYPQFLAPRQVYGLEAQA